MSRVRADGGQGGGVASGGDAAPRADAVVPGRRAAPAAADGLERELRRMEVLHRRALGRRAVRTARRRRTAV